MRTYSCPKLPPVVSFSKEYHNRQEVLSTVASYRDDEAD